MYRHQSLMRAVFCALATVLLSACQGGSANSPAFFTGTAAGAGTLGVQPNSLTFAGTGAAFAQNVTITVSVPTSTVTATPGVACGTGAAALVTLANPTQSGNTFTATVTPQNVGSCTVTVASSQGGSATFTVTVNSAAVTIPAFVSGNAVSLKGTILSVNGSAPTAAQVPASQNPSTIALLTSGAGRNCLFAPGGETCTVNVPAPTGQVVYQFDLFDSSNRKLATNTVTLAVQPGANQFQVQVKPIAVTATFGLPTLNHGTSFSGPITVQAFDASGALIVGSVNYNTAFTVTDNDASAHTSLTLNTTTAKAVTTVNPNDTIILNYDGTAIPSFTITAGGGVTGSGTVTVN
jgi:hypothetical protein